MPVTEADIDVVRRLYSALLNRDVEFLARAFAHASYHVPGNNLVAGTYKGTEAILGLFALTNAETNGTISFTLHDIVVGENHVCVLDRVRGTRKGRTIDQSRVLITHIENGVTTDVWVVVEDEYEFDEFWA
jgi:ketosteroid isomerase-like protein